jgi:hypothetical protein
MRVVCSALVAIGLLGIAAAGCFSTPKIDPCPGKLTCPNEVCCPQGFPFACHGQCYASAAGCNGSSYVTCAGSSGAGDDECPAGQTRCDDTCVNSTYVCCHHGNGAVCPPGDTCGTSSDVPCLKASSSTSGGAPGGGTSGGAPSGGGSSSSAPGVPCSQNVHPAWMQGECIPLQTCNCKLNSCARIANGGCCTGYDLGWIFIPCDGSGLSCGDCTAAAQSALSQCGCTSN